MKRGIILKNDLYGEVYGSSEIADIRNIIDVVCEPLSSDKVRSDPSVLSGCDIIMADWGSPRFDAQILEFAPELKAVFYGGGSVRGIVGEGFWERDIVVSSAYGANAVSVAQYTVAQVFNCLKKVWEYRDSVHKLRDYPQRDIFNAPGTYNSVLGIVSLGMIGWHVCRYIQAITEMKVIAYDPYVDKAQAAAMNVEMHSLEDVFKFSDVVSLHTPVLEETKGMITGEHFRSMKPNSSFINTARGILIKEREMIEALTERPDITAVLDVTYPEPAAKDSPLYDMDNVVITPHIAGCMGPECRRMGRYMIDELHRYINGKTLKWQITREQFNIIA